MPTGPRNLRPSPRHRGRGVAGELHRFDARHLAIPAAQAMGHDGNDGMSQIPGIHGFFSILSGCVGDLHGFVFFDCFDL